MKINQSNLVSVSLACAFVAASIQGLFAKGHQVESTRKGPPMQIVLSTTVLTNSPRPLDEHSTEWSIVRVSTSGANGQIMTRTNRFIELGGGINHRDSIGNWRRSREAFVQTPDGFAA